VKARTTATLFLAAALLSAAGTIATDATDVVEIRLRGRYYAEPATVQLTVAVEPDALNRTLRVEAESEYMLRSSEITLAGAGEKRIHTLEFKNLPAGNYTLSAQVYGADDVRGVATQLLTVSGSGVR
jgi:hypothetical protein